VDPSHVRNQIGTFATAFASHEKRFSTDIERVKSWRAALFEAANCSGWDLKSVANGYYAIDSCIFFMHFLILIFFLLFAFLFY
jgi:hypothetical protein